MPRSFHFSAGIYRVSRSRSGHFWKVGSGSTSISLPRFDPAHHWVRLIPKAQGAGLLRAVGTCASPKRSP